MKYRILSFIYWPIQFDLGLLTMPLLGISRVICSIILKVLANGLTMVTDCSSCDLWASERKDQGKFLHMLEGSYEDRGSIYRSRFYLRSRKSSHSRFQDWGCACLLTTLSDFTTPARSQLLDNHGQISQSVPLKSHTNIDRLGRFDKYKELHYEVLISNWLCRKHHSFSATQE